MKRRWKAALDCGMAVLLPLADDLSLINVNGPPLNESEAARNILFDLSRFARRQRR